MAFFEAPLVEKVQTTPNLTYRILIQYQDYDPSNLDIFTWELPFQLGTVQQATAVFRRQPADPDEVWAVSRYSDLTYQAPDNQDLDAVISPTIQVVDNGVPAPNTIRQAIMFLQANNQSLTVMPGYFAVEYYFKWYKQAEGGAQTFGLQQTSP